METHIVPILYQQQTLERNTTNPAQIASNNRFEKNYFQKNSSSPKQLEHYYSQSPKRLEVSRNAGPQIQAPMTFNNVVGLMTASIVKHQSKTHDNNKPLK